MRVLCSLLPICLLAVSSFFLLLVMVFFRLLICCQTPETRSGLCKEKNRVITMCKLLMQSTAQEVFNVWYRWTCWAICWMLLTEWLFDAVSRVPSCSISLEWSTVNTRRPRFIISVGSYQSWSFDHCSGVQLIRTYLSTGIVFMQTLSLFFFYHSNPSTVFRVGDTEYWCQRSSSVSSFWCLSQYSQEIGWE